MGWLSDVAIRISQEVDGVGRAAMDLATPSSPGFTLDRAEAQTMLDQANQVLTDLKALQQEANSLTQIKSPAQDWVTTGYHGDIIRQKDGQAAAFTYGAQHVQVEIDYLSELISRLEEALGIVQKSDADSQVAVNNVGQTGGGYIYDSP